VVFSRLMYHYDDRLLPLFRKVVNSHYCIKELTHGKNATLWKLNGHLRSY